MRRYLYLWHRWLGIGLCLFMALWLVSGVVMLYVGYPKLTPGERVAHLPPLPAGACCIEPAVALQAAGRPEAPASLRLVGVAGRPGYVLGYPDGETRVVDALGGELRPPVNERMARDSAWQFSAGIMVQAPERVDEDTWTHSRGLDPHRPLYRVRVDDGEQRWLYVSSRSGEVVLDVSARERAWNFLGAWLHWLYPLRGGALDSWWRDLVIYLSLAATLMVTLGSAVGLLRWRFSQPYRSGSRSPYPAGFGRWHHLSGLLFGGLLLAWIFSGLMSMRPWALFDGDRGLPLAALRGGELDRRGLDALPLHEALRLLHEAGLRPHELEWRLLDGVILTVAVDARGDRRVLEWRAGARPLPELPEQRLDSALRRLGGPVSIDRLHDYDFYYYPRAEQSMYGFQRRPLPVLRARYGAAGETWLHLDPASGEVLEQLGPHRRTARWLFNLLHSWDWLPLLRAPAWREALIIVASLGALLISGSGVVLGWRRLRRSMRPARGGRGR
ncbi:TPA: PepSY domain-containing protein [Pseudomonas aeruginosa]